MLGCAECTYVGVVAEEGLAGEGVEAIECLPAVGLD